MAIRVSFAVAVGQLSCHLSLYSPRSTSTQVLPVGILYYLLQVNIKQFLSFSSFICDNCLKKSGKTRKENKFSAKSELHYNSKATRVQIFFLNQKKISTLTT